jgi:tetraacyldisaccharide 4'-kinase
VWYGADVASGLARLALAPASMLYGAVARARGALYDADVLSSRPLALPALGVGNLTVGGTGKTPVAAWLAGRLRDCGARPAIVMRGYGADEPLVHALLSPGMPVIVDADRVRGVAEAARRGADVAVLDDAFQHRRARRDADVVLVAAEHAERRARLLPAGPFREPESALRRASVIVVTRKAAPSDRAYELLARLARVAPDVPGAVVALSLDALRAVAGTADGAYQVGATDDRWPAGERLLDTLRGRRVLAIAAIGEPDAFYVQLERAGAVVDRAPYADHHAFSVGDVELLVRRAERADSVVCTLKDAVKLRPLWPRLGPSLWYVSQRVNVERGGDALDQLLARMLAARVNHNETAGSGRPS